MPSGTAPPDASELIDRLYSALFSEAPWQAFVTRSCDLLLNGKSVLFFHDRGSGAGAMSLTAGVDDAMVQKIDDYYYSVNPLGRSRHETAARQGHVVRRDFAPRGHEAQRLLSGLPASAGHRDGTGRDAAPPPGLHVFFSLVSADVTEDRLEHASRVRDQCAAQA